MTQEVD